jgi:heme exporter protein CcmD
MSIDWAAFWHMGGQGGYVFGAYGAALLLLAADALWLWRRSRAARRRAGEDLP